MRKICEEAYTTPETVLKAPHNAAVSRLDEVKASHPKTMALSWRMHLKKNKQDLYHYGNSLYVAAALIPGRKVDV